MAEVLFRARAEEAGLGIATSSSGTWAIDGEPATEGAVEAMRVRGIDLRPHRSRPFDPDEAREADLIVAMTSVHLREIEKALPGSARKTLLLKEISQLRPAGRSTAPARVEALLDSPRPKWVRKLDLDDPMGLPLRAYERCADELESGIRELIGFLV